MIRLWLAASRRRTSAIAALLVAAGVQSILTGCAPGYRDTVEVRAGQDAVLVFSDILEVRIPGDSLAGDGALEVSSVAQQGREGWHLELTGNASLIGPAELRVMADLEEGEPAPLALHNEAAGQAWQLTTLPDEVGAGSFSFTIDELANWFLVDWSDLDAELAEVLTASLEEPPAVEVSCQGGERAAELGYVATVESPVSQPWCVGSTDDIGQVTVANPYSSAIRIEATPTLTLTTTELRLSTYLARLLEVVGPGATEPGDNLVLMAPGETATFTITSRAPARLSSGHGALESAATALILAEAVVEHIWSSDTAAIRNQIAAASCIESFSGLSAEDLDLVEDVTRTAMTCASEVAPDLFGVEGQLAAALSRGLGWSLGNAPALAAEFVKAEQGAPPQSFALVVSRTGDCQPVPNEITATGTRVAGCIVAIDRGEGGLLRVFVAGSESDAFAAVDALEEDGWQIDACTSSFGPLSCGLNKLPSYNTGLSYLPVGDELNPVNEDVYVYSFSSDGA